MSDCEILIRKIEVYPHPNADRLEIARVDGFECVVGKGQFTTGDLIVYIEDQTIVPEPILRDLNLWDHESGKGELARTNGQVVKPIRLRGVLSEGLVWRPELPKADWVEGNDVTELFGFERWHPTIPASMAGKVKRNDDFIPWINIQNIKKHPETMWGREVSVTAKLHGSACCLTRTSDGTHLISSKGIGKQGLVIEESEANTYWQAYHQSGLGEILDNAYEAYSESPDDSFALFGEVYGTQVNGFSYGNPPGELGFAIFDGARQANGELHWLDYRQLGIIIPKELLVPELYRGKFDHNKIWEIATSEKPLYSGQTHVNEGVVIRTTDHPITVVETVTDDDGNTHRWERIEGRKILKMINPAYLSRKDANATEFE